jgi:hypothetical protein
MKGREHEPAPDADSCAGHFLLEALADVQEVSERNRENRIYLSAPETESQGVSGKLDGKDTPPPEGVHITFLLREDLATARSECENSEYRNTPTAGET